jgi:hypothetical protein
LRAEEHRKETVKEVTRETEQLVKELEDRSGTGLGHKADK